MNDYTIPGGMLCTICGLRYFNQSCGGPGICPSCDCGNFGAAMVERQGKEITRLRAALERIVGATQTGSWDSRKTSSKIIVEALNEALGSAVKSKSEPK